MVPPRAELEQDATSIRSDQPLLVQGVLQTEDYARALLRRGGLLSPDEIERVVAGRMERQAILDREPLRRLVLVIDEVVLCRMVGDHDVMARQVAHVATTAEREQVQVRVIPPDAPGTPVSPARSPWPGCPTGPRWPIWTISFVASW
ncbi:hypothetical protein E1165_09605 [Micromonospora sp. KC723]|nr:DUF5753 domain-containing protein [Micromonospora sp. KC723]TDB75798.1 hypothetical protein E1165_09605 [Micromonospora sp. KC723]